MKIGVTGGTGFVGSHLTNYLVELGHEVVVISRGKTKIPKAWEETPAISVATVPLAQTVELVKAVRDCDAVCHCVGIRQSKKDQTFEAVHTEGTRSLLSALRQQGVARLIHVSFLTARKYLDSPYHHTKWLAEELVTTGGVDYTILKPGILYGEGDGFLTNLKRTLENFPFFALPGNEPKPLAPVHIDDFCRVVVGCLEDSSTVNQTYSVLGPEVLTLSEVVDRFADRIGIIPQKIPVPLFINRLAAQIMEAVMEDPLITTAQLTMLGEDLSQGLESSSELPEELRPKTRFLEGSD